jgi:ethanolamine ammonia-lyase small subunit
MPGRTDADRSLVSNIHARGIPAAEAVGRIADLAALMMARTTSGVGLGTDGPSTSPDAGVDAGRRSLHS